ncbi:unnamed protein product [Cuscuta campestris]|uniref:Cathepsin propeptide inhibitor domain-containing protein n=1 Tax=Cuscuta campestris TaxID=132261 RepID=A0A484L1M7_9ASTE|nr:unnamed protein product [Cuscuta campestris]
MAALIRKSVFLASLLLLLLAAAVWASGDGDGGASEELTVEEEFERWMVLHERKYEDESEKEKRFEIYKKNKEYVESFNRAGNHTYTLGINAFSDLTNEEFADMYLSKNVCF